MKYQSGRTSSVPYPTVFPYRTLGSLLSSGTTF